MEGFYREKSLISYNILYISPEALWIKRCQKQKSEKKHTLLVKRKFFFSLIFD